MNKPTLYTQERMPVDVVPKAKPKEQGYSSFKEMFEDPNCSSDRKLQIVGQIYRFVTLNSVTKDDLHAMLKFMVDEYCEWEEAPKKPPELKLMRGDTDEV